MKPRLAAFGEVLLRLSAPGNERLLQRDELRAYVGGSEANVAIAFAQLGGESRLVTRLPESPLGGAALRSLRAEGVDTSWVSTGAGRMGLYFTETGAGARPGSVVYDRDATAFRTFGPGSVPWDDVLAGSAWLHTSGITAALGEGPCALAAEGLAAARRTGGGTSLDLNFRRNLWTEEEAGRSLRPLLAGVDLLVANEEHLRTVLGIAVSEDGDAGYRDVARRVRDELGPRDLLLTVRRDASASDSDWGVVLLSNGGETLLEGPRHRTAVVDRIGAGDAFVGAFLFARLSGLAPDEALRFGTAAGVLKQTVPGDQPHATREEIERLAAGAGGAHLRR